MIKKEDIYDMIIGMKRSVDGLDSKVEIFDENLC
jgi:hypothetical protein